MTPQSCVGGRGPRVAPWRQEEPRWFSCRVFCGAPLFRARRAQGMEELEAASRPPRPFFRLFLFGVVVSWMVFFFFFNCFVGSAYRKQFPVILLGVEPGPCLAPQGSVPASRVPQL